MLFGYSYVENTLNDSRKGGSLGALLYFSRW